MAPIIRRPTPVCNLRSADFRLAHLASTCAFFKSASTSAHRVDAGLLFVGREFGQGGGVADAGEVGVGFPVLEGLGDDLRRLWRAGVEDL